MGYRVKGSAAKESNNIQYVPGIAAPKCEMLSASLRAKNS